MDFDRTSSSDARSIAKQAAKDSIFRDLFQNPVYLLQLYQALHPEDKTTTADDIQIVSMQNILLNQMYNDLGFIVGRVNLRLLILLEAQSTWSINILVRILLYLALSFKEYVETKKRSLYSSTKIELPKPELYVIYTGERKNRPEWLSLSEEFFDGDASFLDMKVKVIYDGTHGDIINQYVNFTRIYDEQRKKYGRTRRAVLETIRICKDKDVLKQYLEDRQKEVVDIMMTLFSQEYAWDRYVEEIQAESEARGKAEGIEEGIEKGIEKGVVKGKKESALIMRDNGLPIHTIAAFLNVKVDDVETWLAEEPSGAQSFPQ